MGKSERNVAIFPNDAREVLAREVLEAILGIKAAKQNVRWIYHIREALAQQLQHILAISLAELPLCEARLFAKICTNNLNSTHQLQQPRRTQQWVIATKIAPVLGL
jgi:hypothetical protein